jgi:hypothetical protein
VSERGRGRAFWPIGEAAQADYEALRIQALAGEQAGRGLAGLIAWPASEPVFTGPVLGGTRPRWSPHDDPRMDALAAGFAFLLGVETGWATGVMMEVIG